MSGSYLYSDWVPDNWPRNRRLRIIGPLDDQSIREIQGGDFDTLWIDTDECAGFDRIPSWRPDVRRIKITASRKFDVGWIDDLVALQELHLSGPVTGDIAFERLQSLKACDLVFNSTTARVVESGLRLNQLSVLGLKVPLATLPPKFCESIEVLGLERGNIESLDGLERFESLESLSLLDIRKLSDISALAACARLKELDVTSCNSIEEYSIVGGLESLEWLVWENKELDSLHSFLPGRHVEVLLLGQNTIVLDNDIGCVFQFPELKHIRFKNRRTYDCKVLDVNEELGRLRPGPFKTLADRQLKRLI